eukprot:10993-Eustigmatos_ZCMA.PRE.1
MGEPLLQPYHTICAKSPGYSHHAGMPQTRFKLAAESECSWPSETSCFCRRQRYGCQHGMRTSSSISDVATGEDDDERDGASFGALWKHWKRAYWR